MKKVSYFTFKISKPPKPDFPFQRLRAHDLLRPYPRGLEKRPYCPPDTKTTYLSRLQSLIEEENQDK